jgi:hypothetical protein
MSATGGVTPPGTVIANPPATSVTATKAACPAKRSKSTA